MNAFAVTSEGIGTALTKSASVLVSAGNSLDEAIALVTAGNTILQDEAMVGSGLKVVSMRIRGTSASELEEAGEDTEGLIEDASKLYATIKKLTATKANPEGISILTETGDYKSTYEILLEIAKVWEQIGNTEQAALLETLAGKNRANVVAAILQAKDDDGKFLLETVYEESLKSAGATADAMASALTSVESAQARVQNSWQTLWQNAEFEDTIKAIYKIAEGLIKIVDNVGLLESGLTALSTAPIFAAIKGKDGKNLELIKEFFTDFDLSKYWGFVGSKQRAVDADIIKAFAELDGGNDFVGARNEFLDKGPGKNASKTLEQIIRNTQQATDVTEQYNGAVKKLIGNKIAGAAATAGMNIAVGALSAGLSWLASVAISAVIEGLTNYINRHEIAIEKSRELTSAFEENTKTASDNITTLERQRDRFEELSEHVSENGENIALTTEEYIEYKSIVESVIAMQPDLAKGYDEEIGYLVDKNTLLDEAIAKQKELIEQEKIRYGSSESVATLYEGAEAAVLEAQKEYDKAIKTASDDVFRAIKDSGIEFNDATRAISEIIGYDFSKYEGSGANGDAYRDFFEENIEAILANYDEVARTLESDPNFREAQDSIYAVLFDSFGKIQENRREFSAPGKEAANAAIDGVLASFNLSEANAGKLRGNKDKFFEALAPAYENLNFSEDADEIRAEMAKILNDIATNKEMSKLILDMFHIDFTEDSYAEIAADVATFIPKLVDYFRELLGENNVFTPDVIAKLFGWEDYLDPGKIAEYTGMADVAQAYRNAGAHASDVPGLEENYAEYEKLYDYIEEFTAEELTNWTRVTHAIEGAEDKIKAYESWLNRTVEETKKLASVTETVTAGNALIEKASPLKSAYSSLAEGNRVSMSDWSSLGEQVGDLPYFEEFMNTVAGAEEVTADVQQAFNELATSIVYSDTVMDQVIEANGRFTDAQKEIIVSTLEEIGVTNAAAVANDIFNSSLGRLILQQALYVDGKLNLISMTDEQRAAVLDEIDVMYGEAKAAGVAEQYLARLELTKELLNGTRIDSTDDIDNLIKLASAAGLAASAIEVLAKGRAVLEKLEMGAPLSSEDEYALEAMSELTNGGKLSFTGIDTSILNFDSTSGSGGSGSSDDNEIDWIARKIELLEEEITELGETAADAYTPWLERNEALEAQIDANNELLAIQRDAYAQYMAEAEAVELSDEYKRLVEEGGDFVETITDASIRKQIDEYKKWYDQAEDCEDKIKDLERENQKLNAQRLDQIIQQYEDYKQAVENARQQNENEAFTGDNSDYLALNGDLYLEQIETARKAYEEAKNDFEGRVASGELTEDMEAYSDEYAKVVGLSNEHAEAIKSYVEFLKEGNTYQSDYLDSVLNLAQSQNTGETYEGTMNEQIAAIEQNTAVIQSMIAALTAMLPTLDPNSDAYLLVQTAINELQASVEDNAQKIVDAILDDFEKVQEAYENALGLLEHRGNMIEMNMELADLQGYMASGVWYEYLIKNAEEELALLNQERDVLQKKMDEAVESGYVEQYSEAWYQMQNAINEVDEEILQTTIDIQKFENEIRQIKWDRFDYMQEQIATLNDEFEFTVKLMESVHDFVDEFGNLTDYGWSAVSLYSQQMDLMKEIAGNYRAEIDALDKDFADDPLNKDYIERRQELLATEREYILAQTEARNAILDLVEEAYDAQLDKLNEIIDAKKEALQAEKDMYDYQKKVKEQTSAIADIQKKLTAYAGDDSEETKKTVQELKVELQDALDELGSTEYDQYMSEQEEMMDRLYTDYEEWIDKRLDDPESLLADILAQVDEKGAMIEETLNNIANDWNYGRLIESVESIRDRVNAMFERADKNASEKSEEVWQNSVTQPADTIYNGESIEKLTGGTKKGQSTESITTSANKVETINPGQLLYNGGHIEPSLYAPLGKAYEIEGHDVLHGPGDDTYTAMIGQLIANDEKFEDNTKGFEDAWWYDDALKIYNDLLKAQKSSYAVGGTLGKLISESGEDGIFFGRLGEEVVTPDELDKLSDIFDKAEILQSFMNGLKPNARGYGNTNIDNSIGDVSFEVVLPNVQDYRDFKNQLIKDSTFEKAILTAVNNNIAGKSSLGKMRYVR